MESDTSLALLLDILCNSQCVKEQDGSAKDWKNKKCSYCGIYITPILLLLITKIYPMSESLYDGTHFIFLDEC